MKIALTASAIIGFLFLIGWLGLIIKPAPFPPFSQHQPELETKPLPGGLPTPVEKFYRQKYGERVPLITSAVISGRGTLAIAGVKLPMRFRFIHQAGQGFRSDIDITFFGRTVMQAIEIYAGGKGYGKTPGGETRDEAWFDQSANIRMWAEVIEFFPSALLTTQGVRWESIDGNTALLIVPFGAAQDQLIVRFDPENGGVEYIEAMKFKNADSKVLWVNGIWMDDGRPWLVMNVEEVVYNVGVGDRLKISP